ncbi:MAG: hypothetical protein AAF799_25460 [Myxococcota bacterium]
MEHVPVSLAIIGAIVALVLAIARSWHQLERRDRLATLRLQLENATLLTELRARLDEAPSDDPVLRRWIARVEAECAQVSAEPDQGIRSSSTEPTPWLRTLDIGSHNAGSPPVVLALFLMSLGFVLTLVVGWGVELSGLTVCALSSWPLCIGPALRGVFQTFRAAHGYRASEDPSEGLPTAPEP